MGRNATITIKNDTGYPLTYDSDDIKHGKFNTPPPGLIGINGTGQFEVGNRTGAKIGPEGTVTYRFMATNNGVKIPIKPTFFWNHPFGSAKSVYSVGSTPSKFVSYSIDPAQPTGHDQEVTITVRTQNLENAFDIEHWMGAISDQRHLSELSMPGTHDSGATRGGVAAQCQRMDIHQQLQTGIRYLDIRCKLKDEKLWIYHGIIDMHLEFNQVMRDCIDFLSSHDKESVVMCIKEEGDGPGIEDALRREISASADHWHLENSIPILKDIRGKIVLMRRFAANAPLGIDATGWPDDSADWIRNRSIYVQDRYNVLDTTSSINRKWDAVYDTLQKAGTDTDGALFINFVSGSGGITPVMLATGMGIVIGVSGMNTRLETWAANTGKAHTGIIAMDFPEQPDPALTSYIIGLNIFDK